MLPYRRSLTVLILLVLCVPASPFVVPLLGVSPLRTHAQCRHRPRSVMVMAEKREPTGDVFLLKWQLIQDTFHARSEAAFRAACEKWPRYSFLVLALPKH